jgi:hypothetical protein
MIGLFQTGTSTTMVAVELIWLCGLSHFFFSNCRLTPRSLSHRLGLVARDCCRHR